MAKKKRGPGRPPGSKNKKRGPGRPPGSTNKKRGPGRPPGSANKVATLMHGRKTVTITVK